MPLRKKNFRRKTGKRARKFPHRLVTEPANPIITTAVDTALTIMNKTNGKPHKFKRSLLDQVLTQPTGTGQQSYSSAFSYNITSFPSSTEFTNLFSSYKITDLIMTIRMVDSPAPGTAFPILYIWKNYSLAAAGFSKNAMSQIANIHRYQFSEDHRTFSLRIKPYVAETVQGTQYGQMPGSKLWIDSSYLSAAYYGFGMFIDNWVGSGTETVEIAYDVEAYIQCRELL